MPQSQSRPESNKRRTVSHLLESSLSVAAGAIVPECQHGKALKFARTDTKTGEAREFYACSANRDRKICPLFHWTEDWERKVKSGAVKKSVAAPDARREKKAKLDESLGMEALTDNKSNAQFLFDGKSIAIIANIVQSYVASLENAKILCIGTPSIHKSLMGLGLDSTLLDEDARLSTTLPNTHRFNVFNGNMYGGSQPADSFSVIVIDPPFQPQLMPALFSTVKRLFPVSSSQLVLFAFPYFNLDEVVAANTSLALTDVRLSYRNHKKYVSGERSPVRLYSTKPLVEFTKDLGKEYPICEKCNAFSHVSNHHCDACNKCTTIAGAEKYKHCKRCAKCVKPRAVHCNTCKRCFVTEHTCRTTQE